MARKRRSSSGGANWMDTYGDMVTLLLCFFVLLYSISSLDSAKWEAIVRSFNPDAVQTPTENSGSQGPNAEPKPGTETSDQEAIDQLYEELKNYIAQQDAQDETTIIQGEGFVFLSMNNTVFFGGDSYVLLHAGQLVLDDLSLMFSKISDSIDEIRILGHTAQEDPQRPNKPETDRFLASNRATNVLLYLQNKNFIDPARLLSTGYGQWRPVDTNDTPEGRKQNRRVEFIIAGKNMESSLNDSLSEYYSMRQGTDADAEATTPPAETTPEQATP